MSIISSSTNKVSNAVQSAAHEVSQKAEQAVEQLTPKLPTQVIADRFENAPRLYDAGVHHPNRTTVDRISVHGKSFDFRSQGSDGSHHRCRAAS